MVLKSKLCDLLGIQYPILQGGMAWVATGELAAAVSETGALGIIGAGNAPAAVLEQEIRKAKARTDKPFGVNIMLLSPYVEEVVELLCREKIRVITTGAGNPGRYVKLFQENGAKVIPVVSSVALSKRLLRLGVDAMIAEGMEAGGHIGELTTMALVPQIVDAVNVPVIAAGGIADGRGVAAALALGADGVQLGTRFISAYECTAHAQYKGMILKAKDRDTVITGVSTGHPVRVIRNNLTREISRLEKEGASLAEIDKFAVGRLSDAVRRGDVVNGSVMAGQSAAMVTKEESAQDIINDLIKQTRSVISELAKFIG
ncbi:MAG TPA: enoyl-[acyl-carrier-protein] reductase FabK [Oscillospiraceae bacterium]|nr:enoyl-[acyl-carrier-protein] reductase FabK [Oscillospiraceae bacterium]